MPCRYPTTVGAKPVGGLKRQSGLVDWRLRTGGLGRLGRLGRLRILWTAVWSALPVSDNSWSKAGGRSYHTGLSVSTSRSTVRNRPFQSVTVRISVLAPRGCPHSASSYHSPTTSRLPGFSPATGAQPVGFVQGRYRDAIREFCKREARGAYWRT